MTKKKVEARPTEAISARLRIDVTVEVDVRLTRAWFDEISESVPLDDADLPWAVQSQIERGRLLDHVLGASVVGIVDMSDEARARRRAERRTKKPGKERAR